MICPNCKLLVPGGSARGDVFLRVRPPRRAVSSSPARSAAVFFCGARILACRVAIPGDIESAGAGLGESAASKRNAIKAGLSPASIVRW